VIRADAAVAALNAEQDVWDQTLGDGLADESQLYTSAGRTASWSEPTKDAPQALVSAVVGPGATLVLEVPCRRTCVRG